MEKYYEYTTKGTCSRQIKITLDDGIIVSAEFVGGCHGNTQGITKLVKGIPWKSVRTQDLSRPIITRLTSICTCVLKRSFS